jgi:hypothetical protein
MTKRLEFRSLPFGLSALVIASLLTATGTTLAAPSERPGKITQLASTVPANGDLNPYGVVVVPATVGNLTEGNILVSNFNNSQNEQGTGTTIVQITPGGSASLFAQIDASSLPGPCPGGVGLTTALAVLRTGWVIVGSLPTTDGTSATAQAGCLLVLSSSGQVAETFYGSLINGPWDMTWSDEGTEAALYFTNVLNGTVAADGSIVNGGTVVRMNLTVGAHSMPAIESMTVIGSGFGEETNSAALVIGPTGLGLSGDNLYVADTAANRIAMISNATKRNNSGGTGTTLTSNGSLNGPLGVTISPTGNILSADGGDGYLVVTSPRGVQLQKFLLDDSGSPPGAGALFGIVAPGSGTLYYVDDATNTLNLFQ